MKSYTDLEQSRKLAKILPLETADMKYYYNHMIWDYEERPYVGSRNYDECSAIPCWSLAALFKMLPYSARLERGSSTELCYVTLPNELESSDWYIEPVDAVFEMILKLYELKKL